MPIYRVDVRTSDADAFSEWVRDNIPAQALVRSVGYGITDGWYFKNVFSDQEVAEQFHRHWYPDADNHEVNAFGSTAS